MTICGRHLPASSITYRKKCPRTKRQRRVRLDTSEVHNVIPRGCLYQGIELSPTLKSDLHLCWSKRTLNVRSTIWLSAGTTPGVLIIFVSASAPPSPENPYTISGQDIRLTIPYSAGLPPKMYTLYMHLGHNSVPNHCELQHRRHAWRLKGIMMFKLVLEWCLANIQVEFCWEVAIMPPADNQ